MAKKLILKLLGLTIAIVLSGLLIGQFHTDQRDDSYLAAILEKDRLIRNTPSPKIILVGGSNLAFGIDSKAIEDSLGLHVVNMGLIFLVLLTVAIPFFLITRRLFLSPLVIMK